MASSILAGDRRWASTRKSGMTVLGKVPKPINLPSQRLENNGLDPNVEIVPKGTITWGQKPSSSVPNAWTSPSVFSPKTDGSSGSPSHASGRPSSGGGTRPSTASSDRSQDPFLASWGPNSRPSSSSGLLPSNHIPIATSRPRSAETRPGSSQLSRFAENFGEPSGAWAATKPVQKLASTSSRTGNFSLSSGDFPTLGSEKALESHILRGHSSQGRPSSASGLDSRPKEQLERPMSGDGYRDHEKLGVSANDKDSYAGDIDTSSMKLQHGHQQVHQLPSINVRPGQFEPWHGPPLRPQAVWYRGPACAPYRLSGPPGSFSAETFAYYPHQFPPSSEPAPIPGSGHAGYQPMNGEPYHPQLPARPGVYPGPLPYNGYYHQHRPGYPGPLEQQQPMMHLPSQAGLYNRPQNPNNSLNSGQLEVRPSVRDPKLAKEPSQSVTPHSRQTEYKVILKQNDGWDDSRMEEVRRQTMPPVRSDFDREFRQRSSKQEEKQALDVKNNEITESGKLHPMYEVPTQPSEHACNPVIMNPERDINKVSDGILSSKPGNTPLVHEQHPGARKNTLIEKIEGLNNKFRSAESCNEVGLSSFRPDKLKQPKIISAKPNQSVENSGSSIEKAGSVSCQGMPDSVEVNTSNTSNNFTLSSNKTMIRVHSPEIDQKSHFHVKKKVHSSRGIVDNNGKPSSHGQVNEYGAKESSGRVSLVMSTKKKSEGVLQDGLVDGSFNEDFAESKERDTAAVSGPVTPSDSLDYNAQRAKLKEIAAQRAKQLQKEEEERTREQKAKALAKLEELNRRSAAQSLKGKANDSSPSPVDNKLIQHDYEANDNTKVDTSVVDLMVTTDEHKQQSGDKSNDLGASDAASNTINVVSEDPIIPCGLSLPLCQETNATEITSQKIDFASRPHDNSISKQKQMGYRRKPRVPVEKLPGEKTITTENVEMSTHMAEASKEEVHEEKPASTVNKDSPKDFVEATAPVSKLPQNDSYVQHKKKNGRNSRNKNKMDEVIPSPNLPASPCTDNLDEYPSNVQKTEFAVSDTEVKLAPSEDLNLNTESQGSNDVIAASSDLGSSKVRHDARGRVSQQWRRSSRNHQGNGATDKLHGSETVIWAPIRAPTKSDQLDDLAKNNHQSTHKEQDIHNVTKAKRAEIERYVPKPVAKELSYQENLQQLLSVGNATPDSLSEKPNFDSKSSGTSRLNEAFAGKTEIAIDTKTNEEDSKPTKRGRAHTSWRQRISSESTVSLLNSTENLISGSTEPFSKAPESSLPGKPEVNIKSECVEGVNHLISSESISHPAGDMDHGATSRQRSQQLKIHRVAGNYATTNDKHLDIGDNISYPASVGGSAPDARNLSRAENKNVGIDLTRTQWKPKSHHHANTRKGTGGCEADLHPVVGSKAINTEDIESSRGPVEIGNATHLDVKGKEKTPSTVYSSNESNRDANQDVLVKADKPPVSSSAKKEIQVFPVPRQHGHQSGHFIRGQEASYRGRAQGQDSRKQNLHANGDKLKNNTYLEYQPVGSSNRPSNVQHLSSNAGRDAHEVHHAPVHRYREKGNTQPRRNGHFVRRNNAPAVDADNSQNGRE